MTTSSNILQPWDEHVVLARPNLVPLSAPVTAMVTALTRAGGRVLLVGGAVRDALRGATADRVDIDLEVHHLDPVTLTGVLRRFGQVNVTGRSFAVWKVHFDGQVVDVSVPRREDKTGPGHRGFDVIPDPYVGVVAAAARRDFTVNALGWDPRTGQVIDCFGGLGDLHTGTLRHVSDAFGQDPLRVLRAMTFAARFSFTLHPDTVATCRDMVATYAQLPVERIWAQWAQVFTRGVRPSAAVDVLVRTGWLRHFPALAAMDRLEQDVRWHPEGDVLTHAALAADAAAAAADRAGLVGFERAVVVAAALLHDVGKVATTTRIVEADGRERIVSHEHARAGVEAAAQFLTQVGAPADFIVPVTRLVAEHMVAATAERPTPAAVRRLVRRLAPATLTAWSLVAEADNAGRGPGSRPSPATAWVDLAAHLTLPTDGTAPVALLRGQHLIDAGLRPGPTFAPILAAGLQAQDDGQFADEAGALTWLNQHLSQNATPPLTAAPSPHER